MAKRVVIDPVTRIEGHLRLEVNVDENSKVSDAVSSGTAWRGIELVCRDRDPRDVWSFVGRICGVCTSTHSLTSLRAVEDALEIKIPKNANYIRNIMEACLQVHDHIVHFYNLHALDFVSPVEALAADPSKTAALQQTLLKTYDVSGIQAPAQGVVNTDAYPKDFPIGNEQYFAAVQAKVKAIVDSGQLGIFAANWWDHPDYKLLPPEVHLLGVAHYLHILDKQRDIVIPQVVFGGKNPHPHYVVGGMPCAISLEDMNAPINAQRLAAVDAAISEAQHLVDYHYLPDLIAIGKIYVEHGKVDGAGLSAVSALSYGDFPLEPYKSIQSGEYHKQCLVRSNGHVANFAQGVENATFTNIEGADFMSDDFLMERVDHSWYTYKDGVEAKHPSKGETSPAYDAGMSWDNLDESKKYSWVKSPTFKGHTAEVGPLAKYIVVYTKVRQGVLKELTWAEETMMKQIELVSSILGVKPEVWMCSTVGRTACRALDAHLMSRMSRFFFDRLINNIKAGDTETFNREKFDPKSWPKEVKGVGLIDAPRGALGHWIHIKDAKTANYQCIVPTTWNAAPRIEGGDHGTFEQTMIDTHVALADKPVEIVRAIRSFDPCLACATHLFNKKNDTQIFVEV